jgi:ectoine hydroxylase-related dioxygenase (phytanoyl-CoA dioxygenase family)
MNYTLQVSDIGQLKTDGFVVLEQVCGREEIPEIRGVLEDLYARKLGVKEGARFDVLKPSETEAMTLGQLTNPSNFAPALRKTRFVRNANEIARQILGPKAFCSADFVLMKPAHDGAATPWHQDRAYGKLDYDFEELSFWLPLQDVDENSGCMQFVPGTHIGPIRPHRSPNGDLAAHSLECCEPPSPEEIVSVPMKLGDCSIHDGRVLHGSPSNRSAVARYAYILVFRNPTAPTATAVPYPWMQHRRDISAERREVWFRRGGFLVVIWRKFRRGDFSSLSRIRITSREVLLRFQKKET